MPPKKAPTGSTTGRRGAGVSQSVKMDTYKKPQKRAAMQRRRRKVCSAYAPKRYPTRGGTNYNKNRTVQNYSCSAYAKRGPRGPRTGPRKSRAKRDSAGFRRVPKRKNDGTQYTSMGRAYLDRMKYQKQQPSHTSTRYKMGRPAAAATPAAAAGVYANTPANIKSGRAGKPYKKRKKSCAR